MRIKHILGFAFLFVLPLFFGCASDRAQTGLKRSTSPPVDEAVLAKKITFLNSVQDSDEFDYEQKDIAKSLLSNFRKIRGLSKGNISSNDYNKIINLLFNNLNRLSDYYFLKRERSSDQEFSHNQYNCVSCGAGMGRSGRPRSPVIHPGAV